MKVLVINCGSSSLKYQLIDMVNEEALAQGLVERIGIEGSVLTQNRAAAGGFSGYNAQAAQQSATAAPRNWQISARYDF